MSRPCSCPLCHIERLDWRELLLLHYVSQELLLFVGRIATENFSSLYDDAYGWIFKPLYGPWRDVLPWQIVRILDDLLSAHIMDVLLDSCATVAIDAFVRTLLCHSEMITLFGLPDSINWIVEFNGAVFCLLSFLLQLVRIKPSFDDVRVSVEDAVPFARCNESSHICRDLLLIMIRLLHVI